MEDDDDDDEEVSETQRYVKQDGTAQGHDSVLSLILISHRLEMFYGQFMRAQRRKLFSWLIDEAIQTYFGPSDQLKSQAILFT